MKHPVISQLLNRIKEGMESEGGFKADFRLIRRKDEEYEVSIDCPSEKWMFCASGKTLDGALERFKAQILRIVSIHAPKGGATL